MRGAHASCVVAAALGLGGCSLVAVRRPPASPLQAGTPLECTQSPAAPILDTVGAIVTPLAGLGAYGMCSFMQAQQSWASQPKNLRCGTFLLVTIGGTAAYAGSAAYGFHQTGECRRLAARVAPLEGEVVPAPPLPPHLSPPPR